MKIPIGLKFSVRFRKIGTSLIHKEFRSRYFTSHRGLYGLYKCIKYRIFPTNTLIPRRL